ncbi:MAG: IS200/IS605 family transposase [Desulfobacteraceae bacterium]|jgi:REP element-mobilizing transposase RayT|nr:IS200/IS605 family transposase [Desulfobacteraceae bacterium]
MGDLIRKSPNVSILMYHFVCVAKYRRLVISDEVDAVLKDVCIEISKRFEIRFLEIGTEGDHVHFLIQSEPTYSPTKIVTKIKSIIVREIFSAVPSVKAQLWGGEFLTDGYFVLTVGEHANEDVIRQYIQRHGKQVPYTQLHKQEVVYKQLELF